ncbi:MAG: PKD domain-containing protein [Bacteroidales bacterium]|nr:PKD domain-containing protein [Bacteroidales bacterium]
MDDAACEAWDLANGVEYTTISGTSGGAAIHADYGVSAYPTMCLIAPDHSIVEQDIWPISTVSDIITPLESYGLTETSCAVAFEANFSGTPTTVPEGGSVNFTDLTTGGPTTWSWTFDGGTPGTSTDQNPLGIVYNTAGTYTVSLEVSNGTSTDTETKTAYITVEPSTYTAPIADFTGNPTTLVAGNSVDFTDLSLNSPTTWLWEFTGADVTTSAVQNPSGIVYSSPGEFPVKLVVTNPAGEDSLTKIEYIKVILDTSSLAPSIDFEASERLISSGESIDFTDLSANYPISWSWTFSGGTPNSSTDQNPTNITYSIPGIYSVTLSATNVSGTGTLTKTDYIVVTDFPTAEICDTLTNMFSGEAMVIQSLTSTWGYLPGHNGKFVTAYADRYENYMISEVSGLLYPVKKAYAGGGKVTFTVWDEEDGKPNNVLGSKQVYISSIGENLVNIVNFSSPIPVNRIFYIGYQLNYSTPDTLVITMAPNRGTSGTNTLFCKKDGNWQTATSLFDVNTSSAMRVLGCITDIQIIDYNENQILIYPNPGNGLFTIDLGNLSSANISIETYDVSGRKINSSLDKQMSGLYQINLENAASGLYFLSFNIDGQTFTKRVSVAK